MELSTTETMVRIMMDKIIDKSLEIQESLIRKEQEEDSQIFNEITDLLFQVLNQKEDVAYNSIKTNIDSLQHSLRAEDSQNTVEQPTPLPIATPLETVPLRPISNPINILFD